MDDDAIEDLYQKAIQQVRDHPPTCLNQLKPRMAHTNAWEDQAEWKIVCSCGGERGQLLGHDLRRFNHGYEGAPLFVSPLHFVCVTCGRHGLIIDTEKHGYNAEISMIEGGVGDSNYRGDGEGPAVPCSSCGSHIFEMTAVFAHTHFDLIDDEPDLLPKAQDFFDSFWLEATCTGCGSTQTPASYETA